MSKTFFTLTLFCYLIAALKHFLYLGLRKKPLFLIAAWSVILGFILHTAALILRSADTGYGPYGNFYEYTNFFAWTIILVYLIAEFRYKIKDMGSFVVPLALVLLAVATTLPEDAAREAPILKFWLSVHITLSFIGYAAFALTFGAGIMYIIQERQLKSKRPGKLYYRLPSLEILDDLNHKVIDIGFPLFTLGIITGSVWAAHSKGSLLAWDIERTMPLLVTWLIYMVLFIGRITVGWRGRKAASFAIVGFFAVIITYLMHIK